jgi:hypothetical protein
MTGVFSVGVGMIAGVVVAVVSDSPGLWFASSGRTVHMVSTASTACACRPRTAAGGGRPQAGLERRVEKVVTSRERSTG